MLAPPVQRLVTELGKLPGIGQRTAQRLAFHLLRVESLTIDPDAVDPEDVEMLQDLIIAALNEAIRKAEELQQSKLGGAEQGGFDPMSALESLGLGGMGGMGGGGGGGGLPGGMPPGAGGGNRAARRAQKKK